MTTELATKINAGLEAKGYRKISASAWEKETEHGKLCRVYLNRSNGKPAGFVAIKDTGLELVQIDGALLKSDLKSILGM